MKINRYKLHLVKIIEKNNKCLNTLPFFMKKKFTLPSEKMKQIKNENKFWVP